MSVIPAALHRSALRIAFPFAQALWRLTRPRVSGAYAVLRVAAEGRDERWVFITNTYKPGLTLPGGGIRRGESPREAARRETREEVGLDLAAERFSAADAFELEYLHRRDHVHFFEVSLLEREAAALRVDCREVGWAGLLRPHAVDLSELARPVRLYLERRGTRESTAGA